VSVSSPVSSRYPAPCAILNGWPESITGMLPAEPSKIPLRKQVAFLSLNIDIPPATERHSCVEAPRITTLRTALRTAARRGCRLGFGRS
jgi:hypothetical protein